MSEVASAIGPEQLRRELVQVSRSLHDLVHVSIAPICQRHEVTPQQMYVLTALLDESGQSAGQLSGRAGILPTNFSAVCHRLEERGLVRRNRSERDKRVFEFYITDEGRALLGEIDQEVEFLYGSAFVKESPETLEAILVGFHALRDFSQRLVG